MKRKWIRIAAWTIGVVAILSVAASIALTYGLRGFVKSAVITVLRERFDSEVEIRDIRILIFPRVYVVAYGIVLSDVNGRVLYQENPAARDETESFYPKPYIPGSLALNLKPGTPPGEYTLTIKAFDAIGKQQTESRSSFKLE